VAGYLAERQRQNLPTLCQKRKGWATRKIKGRAKTSQLQDELPEWVHRGRGVVNEGELVPTGWATRPQLAHDELQIND
jgi:hypothetical protein